MPTERQWFSACRRYLIGEFRSILFRHNPLGINFGTDPHGYNMEVISILSSLSVQVSSGPEDFGRIVHEAFAMAIGEDAAGTRERYSAIAEEMWQFFQRLRAKVAAIEANLVELNPVFLQFCSRHGYILIPFGADWPGSQVCNVKGEIHRCLDLKMEVKVEELLDRGFHPDLQWSLYARGSLPSDRDPEMHTLSLPVFEHWSYSRFLPILADILESGLDMLNGMKEVEIIKHGRKIGSATTLS